MAETPKITKSTATVTPVVDTARKASTQWVAIAEMGVTPAAQRRYEPKDASAIAASFDLEALGYPVLNLRGGRWWIIDGQHRVGALRLMGWGDQKIECECYEGLTEQQEAALFLRRDARRMVPTLDKFRIGVTAEFPEELAITAICEGLDIRIGAGAGRLQAVGTLRKVYRRAGGDALARTLLILSEAYGDGGWLAWLIDGMGLVVQRYGNDVDTAGAVQALQATRGGVTALEQKAVVLAKTTGHPKGACAAAAIVKILNASHAHRGARKLPTWWREAQ